jgi:hypothetical protein
MVLIFEEVAVSNVTSLAFIKLKAWGSRTMKLILSAFSMNASKISFTIVVFALIPVEGLHP